MIILISSFYTHSITGQNSNDNIIFIDNFNDNEIDNSWTTMNQSTSYLTESGGTLKMVGIPNNTKWSSSSLIRPLQPFVKSINVEFNYSMKSMGRIYLIGMDITKTKNIWLVGITDGWSDSNARPIIYLYDKEGNSDLDTSWNTEDIQEHL